MPDPVLATIELTVTYAPNPATAALLIVENGMNDGPYPCAVGGPAADGITYTLTANLTSLLPGLAPGDVQAQAGDIALGGAFVPAVVNGTPVPPVNGTLAVEANASGDLSIVITGVYFTFANLAPVITASASSWLHIGLQAEDAVTGEDAALASSTVVQGIAAAVVRNDPQASDWQPAQIITRAAGDALDGEYAVIKVGPTGALLLSPGLWDIWIQITTPSEVLQIKAASALTVI